MYDRVIWDFNGTILDDLSVGIESANCLLERHGLPIMESVEAYHRVFGFPVRDYYARLGFDFTKVDYETLAHEWVAIYWELVKTAPIRDGVLDVISELTMRKVPQTVLSMTESDMLLHQVALLGLSDTFDEIRGRTDIYAGSKLNLAKSWREEHPNERVLFIGDTTHDAESAAVIGCNCLLLAGGHQSKTALLASGVTVIDDPHQILEHI